MGWLLLVAGLLLSIRFQCTLAHDGEAGFETKRIGTWKQDICVTDDSDRELLTVDFGPDSGASIAAVEVQPLVVTGPSANRVDIVFFSDGYLASERTKFFADAQRLADDMTQYQTFSTVQPLMNFWGGFTASNQSGIGVGGRPKNTAYQLYRDGTELRGVYFTSAGRSAVNSACSALGQGCDHPVILGNDPYYGGLGGAIATVTSSSLNGPIVLRHELGHTIIGVGEEYDGGTSYFGVNSVQSTSSVTWKHWLTDASNTRAQRAVMPLQGYVWTLLNSTRPWSTNFTSSGTYSRHLIKFSLSGLPSSTDLKAELDGVDLKWQAEPRTGMDRWHYDTHRSVGLSAGTHQLKFTLLNKALEGTAQLCNIEILEYGSASEFNDNKDYIGLYPTFSSSNRTTYRPTNENCLMRNMTHPNFCSVCKEGLWLSLLKRVSLIDSVAESCSTQGTKILEAKLLPLAQFRQTPLAQELYTVTWKRNGQVLSNFANLTQIEITTQVTGNYTVDVQLHTDEVRLNDSNLKDTKSYVVSNACT
ncbi:IgA peptidase M64-domain-containing protein [Coprinopsis sp. MPI-PUGE-AT-0042]|nr:IgA peptidase M64-domain-containing protein [Coprinopsis sp. MPI-PUGE-AT-0042]